MAGTFIQDLAVILTVTTAFVLFLRLFKQPPIIAYILSGVTLGPSILHLTQSSSLLHSLGRLGIAFLLFLVGLHLDMRSVRRVGIVSVIVGLSQIVLTSFFGLLISFIFSFTIKEAIFIGMAFSFSSTILAVKLLADKKQIDTLHGRITIGVLLVQDLVAIGIMVFLPSFAASSASWWLIVLITLIKGFVIALLAWGVHVFILPSLIRGAAKNQEVLFLFSITWCFLIAVIFEISGFSLEIGAIVAGFLLASTPYSYEISSRIRPLRDFFVIIFFIILGSNMDIGSLSNLIIPSIILSLYVVLGNTFIVFYIMGFMGFSKRVSFQTGINLGQISEFSLIVLALGAQLGYIKENILSMGTFVGLLTIAASTYMIENSDYLYKHIGSKLYFKRRGIHRHEERPDELVGAHDVIIFGFKRMGSQIIDYFGRKKNVLIVDHDPETVLKLQKNNRHAIFGDASDIELYSEIPLDKAKIIISTLIDIDSNRLLTKQVRKHNSDAILLMTASQPEDALLLYEAGADYVIIPHTVSGDHARVMLDLIIEDIDTFMHKKTSHYQQLKKHIRHK